MGALCAKAEATPQKKTRAKIRIGKILSGGNGLYERGRNSQLPGH
jgi:hypothetical protein